MAPSRQLGNVGPRAISIQKIIDDQRIKLRGELGLVDADFIKVPVFYFAKDDGVGGWVQGSALAMVPNLSNLFMADGNVVLPKPFAPVWNFDDIYLDPTRIALDQGGRSCTDNDFVDDWTVYHRHEGEVHCGTNARRVPANDEEIWWTKWKD